MYISALTYIICGRIMRLPYPFNEIIAQSNMYEMSGFGKLKMIGKEVCLEIENVDIFRNLSSNDLKGLLEKKSLTVSAPIEKHFQCTASPSGWKLTLFALKKKGAEC